MSAVPRGVPNLTPNLPKKRKGFFAPIFSFFPTSFPSLRTFRLWPGGSSAVGPVNTVSSWGGVRMSPELALQLSAVWACVWRYANIVSTLPLHTLQTLDGNTAKNVTKHPLYMLLHDRPNAQMSAAKFWQGMIATMLSWGGAFARKIVDDKTGNVIALDPWRSEFVTTYLDANSQLRYRYQPNAGPGNSLGQLDLPAEEVFVLLDRSMDGISGLSRIQYGVNSLSLATAADRAASLTYKNGMRASGILTIAQWLKPEQRAAYKALVNEFTGTGQGNTDDKQYGVFVAENATKFEQLSLRPQDVELLASRRFSVEDICRWYDVPPVLVGHAAEGQTMWGSGIEQIILGWFKLSLGPMLRMIEQEIWRQLLSSDDRVSGIFAEFNLDALLRGDSAARATFISTMTQNGIYTRNEVRARENLPPVEGGDVLTVQSNMVPLDKLGTLPADQAAQVRMLLRQFLEIPTDTGAGK